MPFDIRFTGETSDDSEIGNAGYYGELTLGEDSESFVSLIGYWSPRDYEQQWLQGIQRVIVANRASCLITSIHDPADADVISWWLLYPDGEVVHVREALLLLKDSRSTFSTADPYAAIPARQLNDESGAEISEWTVARGELQRFLDQRAGSG
jgi:hypothetical protein